ncbi:class I SAM-dependent methyltransferase [Roseateles sp. BYS180W]|uniref:Class I SAM-dependent methyltransferase n=1 Tax=Roseateles rivi TaxID=3299028 RepID=A0ABW7FV16_9BURK
MGIASRWHRATRIQANTGQPVLRRLRACLGAHTAWHWPAAAALSWVACWALWQCFDRGAAGAAAACVGGVLLAALHRQRWRQLMVALGAPAMLLLNASASAAWPAWVWLLALLLLLVLYPLQGWRDAPWYPTPLHALQALPSVVRLPAAAKILDAGCGAGHGLAALRLAYPQAQLQGIEASHLLGLLARLRCPGAKLHRGDLWEQSWSELDMVYVFQRPESMAPLAHKAAVELADGAWFVSLDFPVPGVAHHAKLDTGTRHALWVYRADLLRQSLKTGAGASIRE